MSKSIIEEMIVPQYEYNVMRARIEAEIKEEVLKYFKEWKARYEAVQMGQSLLPTDIMYFPHLIKKHDK